MCRVELSTNCPYFHLYSIAGKHQLDGELPLYRQTNAKDAANYNYAPGSVTVNKGSKVNLCHRPVRVDHIHIMALSVYTR